VTDAFLFGRLTYELFAGYWGVREALEHPVAGARWTRAAGNRFRSGQSLHIIRG